LQLSLVRGAVKNQPLTEKSVSGFFISTYKRRYFYSVTLYWH